MIRYDSKVKASYRYCRVTKVYKQGDIVRTVDVKIGARGAGGKCREMTVGVQRLSLVTPVESIEKELTRHVDQGENVGEGDVDNEEVMENGVETSEEVSGSREIRNLEVPNWMKPANSSRSCCFSIMNHSTLQGLNMGLWVK